MLIFAAHRITCSHPSRSSRFVHFVVALAHEFVAVAIDELALRLPINRVNTWRRIRQFGRRN